MAKKAKTQVSNAARSPDPLDVQIGTKVRVRRIEQRMAQTDLAKAIGVTFQQVQKYEKGTNRIGGSRLARIAQALEIDANFFLDSAPKNDSGLMALVNDKASQRMLQAFHKIKDGPMRHQLVGLLESITG